MGPELVCVVDDDESVRESLPDLLGTFGYASQVFSSAEAFLASDAADRARCLIADIKMPGLSGPAMQAELRRRGREIPIVFITAFADDALRARLLAQGAVDCLAKPFGDTALLRALTAAMPRGA